MHSIHTMNTARSGNTSIRNPSVNYGNKNPSTSLERQLRARQRHGPRSTVHGVLHCILPALTEPTREHGHPLFFSSLVTGLKHKANIPFTQVKSMRLALSAASLFALASAFTPATRPATFARTATTSLNMALSQDELKKMVGYKSVDDYVKSGMVVGLGTGSTAYYAVERVGELLKSGELTDILAIPTSIRTKEQAERLGIPLVTLDTHSKLDVAIDGADEVDPDLNLVKGGGGALLREKMVEVCADKFIVIGECR